jgi:hypothetical protein
MLKFFDVHPGSRIGDGKNSDQGSRMEKIWIQDTGWKKLGSGIQDPG